MIKIIIGIVLFVIGLAGLLYAGITQMSLSIQMYGAVFEHVMIPHISLLGWLGLIPLCIGWCMLVY